MQIKYISEKEEPELHAVIELMITHPTMLKKIKALSQLKAV